MSTRATTRLFAWTLGCALLCAAPARAIDPAAGTGGASFMKLGLGSARALALGRAYVSLAEGADALTWNPAGLALAQQREFAYSYYRYIQNIDSPMYMGYAHPLGRTVLGANFAYLSIDGFDARDELGRRTDETDVRVQDGFATFSAARSFWYEKVFLGASLKGVHEDNAGTTRSSLVGDLGALFRPNSSVTFGFAAQNLGAGSSKVAQISRFGASGRLMEMLTLSAEFSKASDNATRAGIGAEFTLPEDFLQVGQVQLRAGFQNSDDMGQVMQNDRSFLYPLVGSPRWSFGIGLYTAQAFGYGVAFDYSLISMGALGTADMMSLKVKF
ncbi:MAG: hypothetical protein WC969_12440 [Elusimicrobiota bacterium]